MDMGEYSFYINRCWYCTQIFHVIHSKKRYGVNEIARLVKDKMSRKTAIKHIHELIESGTLISARKAELFLLYKEKNLSCVEIKYLESLIKDKKDHILLSVFPIPEDDLCGEEKQKALKK